MLNQRNVLLLLMLSVTSLTFLHDIKNNDESCYETSKTIFVTCSHDNKKGEEVRPGSLRWALNQVNEGHASSVRFKLKRRNDTIILKDPLPILQNDIDINGSNENGSKRQVYIQGSGYAVAGLFISKNLQNIRARNLTFGNLKNIRSKTGVIRIEENGDIIEKDAKKNTGVDIEGCRNINLRPIVAGIRVEAGGNLTVKNTSIRTPHFIDQAEVTAIIVEPDGKAIIDGVDVNGEDRFRVINNMSGEKKVFVSNSLRQN